MSWERFKQWYVRVPSVELGLDASRAGLDARFLEEMAGPMKEAFRSMKALEAGEIANPSEKRMVGHYWLRAPERAPRPELRAAIEGALRSVKDFARQVHSGEVRPERAERFRHLLLIGIGGSALGPQLAADALGGASDRLRFHSIDNTDPDGIDRALSGLPLAETLVLVISKSGGTKETRNGMLEVSGAYRKAGLSFEKHAAAVTGDGSLLDRTARDPQRPWRAIFPMWDWVGGRTSETSAVGLLPAALQGIDIDALLAGARAMDEATRVEEPRRNPAALLALLWHHAGGGKGHRDMVVLPYKDRLLLLSRYLQQLVMESLGKEKDLQGRKVDQGIAVYGNKGSTDQHAYVQQLRDGLDNFFATFIEVREDRAGGARSPAVETVRLEPGKDGVAEPIEEPATSGDFLGGFLRGTREALSEKGRASVTIDVLRVDARTLGTLIALFERAVGLYAFLVGINAYDQPGVEAGKKAAEDVLRLQARLLHALRRRKGSLLGVEEAAEAAGAKGREEMVFHLLERLAANPADHGVVREAGRDPFSARYGLR